MQMCKRCGHELACGWWCRNCEMTVDVANLNKQFEDIAPPWPAIIIFGLFIFFTLFFLFTGPPK